MKYFGKHDTFLSSTYDRMTSQLRKHPIATFTTAAAIGFLAYSQIDVAFLTDALSNIDRIATDSFNPSPAIEWLADDPNANIDLAR